MPEILIPTIDKYYIALIEFLLLSKRNVIDMGARFQLTPMQSMTILVLSEPRSMHSLTKIFGCDASNVTGIIDGLVRKELASRYENPDDRRIKMVKLAKKGNKIRNVFIKELTGKQSYIFSKLSGSESTTFLNLMQKITA